jgi:hypothetical protein
MYLNEFFLLNGIWKLYNEELNDLYHSPTVVWVIQSRRIGWAGYVARMGEGRGVYRYRWENLREGDQ